MSLDARELTRTMRRCAARLAQLIARHLTEAPPLDDLLAWGRRFLPAHFTRPPSAMHRWLSQALGELQAERGARLNVLGPRGGAKSTLATLAYPLRMAVESREPYLWIVSDTRTQACAHLENLKAELLDNRRLARAYPAAVGRGSVWRAGAITLGNGAAIEAFGTGQRIRGRRRRATRPTLIVCDDLQNDLHIRSAELRRQSREWFHGTLLKAGTPSTNVVNVATALHREALAMELCRTPGWTSRTFRAIQRWPDAMDLWHAWEEIYTDLARPDYRQAARAFYDARLAAMDAGAELLWPEVEDLYHLMCQRVESGRAAFDREKQNEPVNPELCEWPESYFGPRIWFDQWPAHSQVKTMALDPSKGADARRGDYSAYVMLGIDRQGLIHVEADLARRPTPQMVADGVALAARFHPDALAIETNQYQELLAEQFAAELAQAGQVNLAPLPLDNRVNKLVRIRRLGPHLAAGRLRFKAGSAGTALLVEQLRSFPIGDHDDGPDALEMALRLAGEWLAPPPDDGLGDRLPIGY